MTQNQQDPNDPRIIARKKRQTAALKANMRRRKESAKEAAKEEGEPNEDSGEVQNSTSR